MREVASVQLARHKAVVSPKAFALLYDGPDGAPKAAAGLDPGRDDY
jgi:hypothetical protein